MAVTRLHSHRASFDFAQDEENFVCGIFGRMMPHRMSRILSEVEGRNIVL